MATTENLINGDGTTTQFSFSFPYIKPEDVRVELQEIDSTKPIIEQIISTTAVTLFTIPSNNPTLIQFNSLSAATNYQAITGAPLANHAVNTGNTIKIRIYRSTSSDQTPAKFFSGSAIRSQDLNDNFDSILYINQEKENELNQVIAGGIADGSITTAKLADNAVTTAKIVNDAVTTAKLADGAVTASNYTYPSGVQQTVQARLEQYVSVKDFGAVGDGVTDDTAAIQAAVDYLAAKYPSHMSDSGASLYFPPGEYYVTSTINVPSTFDGAGFYGEPGKGSLITTDRDIVVFMVGEDLSGGGDASTSNTIYHCTFSNLFFYNKQSADNAVAIQLNRASLGGISDCAFYGWWKHVVGYRANQWEITNTQFRVTAPRANAQSMLELNGVYDSSNSYTPGGGLHITDCEFWGGGFNNIQNVIKVNSVDGLYITQCHTTGGLQSSLSITPPGTSDNHTITDVRVINTYFDNAITQGQHVLIGGSVTSNTSLYQDIFFSTCKFRGTQGGTSDCVKIAVDNTNAGTFSDSFKEVSFDQCEFIQAGNRGLSILGSTDNCLEVENLIVSNCFFGDNNHNNVAALIGGDAYIEARGASIIGCNFDTSRNTLKNSVQLSLSDTTTYNHSLVLTSNNFAKVNTTDGQPYRIPIAKGMRTVVSGNAMPQAGTTIDDTYTTNTTGYSGGLPFLFPVTTAALSTAFLVSVNAVGVATNGGNEIIVRQERYVLRTNSSGVLSQPHNELIYELNNLNSNECPSKLILLNGNGASFSATTAYAAGAYFVSGGNVYLCITTGVSSGSAPTHTSGAAMNGTARFIYVAAEDADSFTVFVSGDSGVDLDWSVNVKLVSAN